MAEMRRVPGAGPLHTPPLGGYNGKILRVNLSNKIITTEILRAREGEYDPPSFTVFIEMLINELAATI